MIYEYNNTNNWTNSEVEINITIFISSSSALFIIILLWVSLSSTFFAAIINLIINLIIKYFLNNKDLYINIGKIHIAGLGGKFLFKDLMIMTENYTIFILDGYLTIKWWLFFKRRYYFSTTHGGFESHFHVNLNGFEMLVYNSEGRYNRVRNLIEKQKGNSDIINIKNDINVEEYLKPDVLQSLMGWARSIGLNISKGNFILGNHKLHSLLQVKFKSASGVIRIDEDDISSYDIYRFIVEADLQDAILEIVKNEKEEGEIEGEKNRFQKVKNPHFTFLREVEKPVDNNYLETEKSRLSPEELKNILKNIESTPNENARYSFFWKYDKKDENLFKKRIKEERVFKASFVKCYYYYDKPGIVKDDNFFHTSKLTHPKQGIDLHFKKLKDPVVYGPFAEHHRSLIQEFFLPPTYLDAESVEQKIGELRKYKFFEMKIIFSSNSRWIVPFIRKPQRPEEKERDQGKQENWELCFSGGSSLVFKIAWGAFNEKGYQTKLIFNLKELKVVTSNTEKMFMNLKEVKTTLELNSGIKWNDLKTWGIDIALNEGDLWYLNEHRRLISDLINDWTNYNNSTPNEKKFFVPKNVSYNININNVNILMHANKGNIVDQINDQNSNIFLNIFIPEMAMEMKYPALTFLPEHYNFKAEIKVTSNEQSKPWFSVVLPESHRVKKGLGKENHQFLSFQTLYVELDYIYHRKARIELKDCLKLDFTFIKPRLLSNGYYIKYLTRWFQNYFTAQSLYISKQEFIKNGFKNLKSKHVNILQDTNKLGFRKPKNDIELVISIAMRKFKVDLPLFLYTTKKETGTASISELNVEIISMKEYAEICLDSSPVNLQMKSSEVSENSDTSPPSRYIGVDSLNFWIFLEFGPYPDTNIYHIIFKLIVGDVTSKLSSYQVANLLRMAKVLSNQFAAAFEYDPEVDDFDSIYENRVYTPTEVKKNRNLDISVMTKKINAYIYSDREGVINVGLNNVKFKHSTLNNCKNNNEMSISVPFINIQILTEREAHKKVRGGDYAKVGNISTGIEVKINTRHPTILQDYREQKAFLSYHEEIETPEEDEYLEDESLDSEGEDDEILISIKDLSKIEGEIAEQEKQRNKTNNEVLLLKKPEENFDDFTEEITGELTDIDEEFESASCATEGEISDEDEFGDAMSDCEDNETEEVISIKEKKPLTSLPKIKVTPPKRKESLIIKRESKNFDEDEDEFFLTGSAGREMKFEIYEKYLKNYNIVKEKCDVNQLNNTYYGSYSDFPEVDIVKNKNIDKGVQEIYKKREKEKVFVIPKISSKQKSSVLEEEVSQKHINLIFNKQFDIFLTPQVITVLDSLLTEIAKPRVDMDYIVDNIEIIINKLHKKELKKKKKKKKLFKFQKIIFSCFLPLFETTGIQTIIAPELYKSPFLGKLTTHSIKVIINNFFCVTSITIDNEKEKDKVTSLTGKLEFDSFKLLTHFLSKKKKSKLGLHLEELPQSIKDSKIPQYPLTLSCNFDEISVNIIYKSTDERKVGLSCKNERGIHLHCIQEIPAILFMIFDVWSSKISTLAKRMKDFSNLKKAYELTLVAILSESERTKISKENIRSSNEGEWVLPSMDKYSKKEALEKIREKVNFISPQQERNILTNLRKIDTHVTKEQLLHLQRKVFYYYVSLFEVDSVIKSTFSIYDKRLRGDISLFFRQIKFLIHSPSKIKSIVYFRHISLEGIAKMKEKQTREQRLLKSVRRDSRAIKFFQFKTTCSSSVKEILIDIHPHCASFISCVMGILIEYKKKKKMREETSKGMIEVFKEFDNTKSIIVKKNKRKKKGKKFKPKARFEVVLFTNLLIEKLIGRAWVGEKENLNNIELDIDNISVLFNQPINQISKDDGTLMKHSSNASIDKIKFQYQFNNTDAVDSTRDAEYISLFNAHIKSIKFDEFLGLYSGRRHLNILFKFKEFYLNIPYTGILWVDAVNEINVFIKSWFASLKEPIENTVSSLKSPDQDLKTKIIEQTSVIKKSRPLINFNLQLQNVELYIDFLAKMRVELKFPKIILYYHEERKNNFDFRVRVSSSIIRFQPLQKKKIHSPMQFLPSILVYGMLKKDENEKRDIMVRVCMETIVSKLNTESLNYVISFQSTFTKEIKIIMSKLRSNFKEVDPSNIAEDLTKKVLPTIPPIAQNTYSEVKKTNMNIQMNLDGIKMSLVGGQPLQINFNTGNILVKFLNINDSNVIIKDIVIDVTDTYKYNEKTFIWGYLKSNISMDIRKIAVIEVKDTHIFIKPGLVEQLIFLFRDYQMTAVSIKDIFNQLDKTEEMSLVKEKMVKPTARNVSSTIQKSVSNTKISNKFLIKINNTVLQFPIGENPYYSVLKNCYSNFTPVSYCHNCLTSVTISGKIKNVEEKIRLFTFLEIRDILGFFNKNSEFKIENYNKSKTKYKIETITMKSNSVLIRGTAEDILRSDATFNISAPTIISCPSFTSLVLLMKDDFIPFRSPQNRISIPGRGEETTNNVVKKKTERNVKKTMIYQITSKMKMETGMVEIKKYNGEMKDFTIMNATLPSLDGGFTFLSPSTFTQSLNRRSTTHISICINWKGIKVSQDLTVAAREVLHIYKEYLNNQRKELQKKKDKQYLPISLGNESLKPLAWIKCVRAAIIIQRIYKGYITRKIIWKMVKEKGKLEFIQYFKKCRSTKKKKSIEKANTFSFLFRINPFKVTLTCKPISDVQVVLKFSKPFHLLFSRSERRIDWGTYKGNSLYNSVFTSLPELNVEMTHPLSQTKFFMLKIVGINGNFGRGIGRIIRPDTEPVNSISLFVDKILTYIDISQMDQLFVMYIVWKSKYNEISKELFQREFEKQNEIRKFKKKRRGFSKIVKEEEKLTSTASFFGQICVNNIQVKTDLTVVVGKQEVNIRKIHISLKDRGRFSQKINRDKLHIGMYIGEILLKTFGRIKGDLSIKGIGLALNRHFRVEGEKPILRGKTDACLKIAFIKTNFSHQLDHVFFFSTEKINLKFRDSFDTPNGMKFHVQNIISFDKINFNFSSYFAPMIVSVINKIKNIVKDKNLVASETMKSFTRFYRNNKSSEEETETEELHQIDAIKDSMKIERELTKLENEAVGLIVIKGREFDINVHTKFDFIKNNGKEVIGVKPIGEFLKISSKFFEIELAKIIGVMKKKENVPKSNNPTVMRRLFLAINSTKILRNSTLNKSNFIIDIQDAKARMLSEQAFLSHDVNFSFNSSFVSPIRVTTNISEYNFFKSIVSAYKNAIKKELEQFSHVDSILENFDKEFGTPSTASAASSFSDFLKKKEKESGEKTKKIVEDNLKFSGKVILKPKLNVLGEMTPSVDTVLKWLGVKDENRIPKIIHLNLTKSMEKILNNAYKISHVLDKSFQEKLEN